MKFFLSIVILINILFFQGCSKSTVILLDSGKSQNAIIVSTDGGDQKLDKVGAYVDLKDKETMPSEPKIMSKKEISNRFLNVLNSIPKKAKSHILYFKPNSTELMDVSKKILLEAYANIKKRTPCIVDIIGHTDTVGSNEVNIKVSLKRAKYIKSLIKKEHFNITSMKAKGYGEEDLQVHTNDNVDEAKNRNVEILIK